MPEEGYDKLGIWANTVDWQAYTSVPRHIIYVSLFGMFLWPFRCFTFCIINIFLLVREAERLERLKSEINGSLYWVNWLKRYSVTQIKIIINGKYETEKSIWNKMKQNAKFIEKLTVRLLLLGPRVSPYFGDFHPSTSHFSHWTALQMSFLFFLPLWVLFSLHLQQLYYSQVPKEIFVMEEYDVWPRRPKVVCRVRKF